MSSQPLQSTAAGPSNTTPSFTSAARAKQSKQDLSLVRLSRLIKSGKIKNVVVLTGAGISTSAGIPDFRSPHTGLYANLARLNLPFPEAVFELGYFKKNPVPFWTLAKDLYPGKYLPTPTHYFLTLLHRHSLLKLVFSQNIDTLETLAGLPPSHIVEAHGSFAESHCLSCGRAASREYVLQSGVREGKVVKCEKCGGLVKPDIVFFGEGLPARFFQHIRDMKDADLLIIIGTSLQVHPFASLPDYCRSETPRLLINREAVGDFTHLKSRSSGGGGAGGLAALLKELGLDAKGNKLPDDEGDEDVEDEEDLPEDDDGGAGDIGDVFWEGDADDGIRRFAQELGWEEELDDLIKHGNEALRSQWAEAEGKSSGLKESRPKIPSNELDRGSGERTLSGGESGTQTATAAAEVQHLTRKIDEQLTQLHGPKVDGSDRDEEEGSESVDDIAQDDAKIPAENIGIMDRFLKQERDNLNRPVNGDD